MTRLTDASWVDVSRALRDAIRQEGEFHEIARRMNWNYGSVASFDATGDDLVRRFIEYAETRDCVPVLLRVALQVIPGNQLLASISEDRLEFAEVAPTARTSVTPQQRARFADQLANSFVDAELQSIVEAVNPVRSAAWEDGPPTTTSVNRFVDAAVEEGWYFDLEREVRKRTPIGSELAASAAERGQTAASAALDEEWKRALGRQMFSGGYFMINRTRLRSRMRDMVPSVGRRILLVRGETKTGLSHTVRLVEYLSEVCDELTAAVVDLEEASRFVGPGRNLTPRDLARQIVNELGYDIPLPTEPDDRQWSAWNLDFAKELVRRAKNDPRRVFLVIDSVHKVGLSWATTDLLHVLSTHIGTKLVGFRLVLVGYRDDLPAVVRQARLVDETSALTEKEVTRFFVAAYEEANVEIGVAELVQKVQVALDGQTSFPPGSLTELSERVQRELPGMTA